ncbi:MAG: hypothetical protein QNK05_17140 [Myxococcota bacterium]|nr:hypothetical protein [Myxococcota bacterium]
MSAAVGMSGRRRERPGARLWRNLFSVALVILLATGLANLLLSEMVPGNIWGIAYGTAAATLMIGAAFFGVRRRMMHSALRLGLGGSRQWLYFHLYGGLLFLLLMFMHTGFRLPEGVLGWWMWLLAVWTGLTGLLGLALQQWIPKALGSGLGLEVHYDRIPELVAELRDRAEELSEGGHDPVRQLHARKVAPELAAPRRSWRYFIDPTGSIHSRLREFDYLRSLLGGEEARDVEALEGIYRAKLEMDAHYTLQWALRSWLYLHVPISLVLVAIVAVHIGTVLYY